MYNTYFLPLRPGPLWPGVVAPVGIQFMGQIELFNHLFYGELFEDVETNDYC